MFLLSARPARAGGHIGRGSDMSAMFKIEFENTVLKRISLLATTSTFKLKECIRALI